MGRWVGMVVAETGVVVVDAEVPDDGPIVIQNDQTMKLPTGPREQAYAHMHRQVARYLRENGIERVIIMASTVSRAGGGAPHLDSAELRGVVTAAAAAECATEHLAKAKAKVSKSFGDRKADGYIADTGFWDENVEGVVRAGSRMAALILLAARKAG